MAFTNIPKALAIPTEAVSTYTFWALPGPPTITCRHAGDGTRGYKNASWQVANARRAKGIPKKINQEVTEDFALAHAKLVADHCVISWTNVIEDGATDPAPCTPAKVLEFLTAIVQADDGLAVYGDFRAWVTDADNFRPAQPDLAELGKR
jgi:hypothetical protein